MHGLVWFAGLLGLIALAFGHGASVVAARVLLAIPVVIVILITIDKMTHGALSDML